jgi:hypothetical protein
MRCWLAEQGRDLAADIKAITSSLERDNPYRVAPPVEDILSLAVLTN